MEHRLLFDQVVPHQREEVFAFFSDAHNLEKITPASLRFHVVRIDPEPVCEGTVIEYRLRLHGIPLRWRSRIIEWEPPQRFIDIQLDGPYRLWHHTHEFEAIDGSTRIVDRVRYELPLGVLGRLAAGWLVARDLDRVFRHRQATIARLFG